MDEIRMALDVGVEEAKRLLASRSVVGFWPKLKASWRRVPGPPDWNALPPHAVAFRDGSSFLLEELTARGARWTKGYHMLKGSLSERGAHALLEAQVALQTWDTFSVKSRVCFDLLVYALVIWASRDCSPFFAKVFGLFIGLVIAVYVFINIFYARHDRKAFIRMLELIFEGHVCGGGPAS